LVALKTDSSVVDPLIRMFEWFGSMEFFLKMEYSTG